MSLWLHSVQEGTERFLWFWIILTKWHQCIGKINLYHFLKCFSVMSCDELLLNRCHPKNNRNSKRVDIINMIHTKGIVSFPLLTEYADGYQQNLFFFVGVLARLSIMSMCRHSLLIMQPLATSMLTKIKGVNLASFMVYSTARIYLLFSTDKTINAM